MSEVEDLRAATREAHEAMKDMRLLMRDARCLITDIQEAVTIDINDKVSEQIRLAITVQLMSHQQEFGEAIEEATALVYKRFAEIGDILMGDDRNAKRAGSAIHELAQQWVADQS